MVMKVLFFDTCAVVKYWIAEPGHDVVRWLCDPETKVLLGLSFSTSEQVEKEFYAVIDRIAKNHKNPKKYASAIKDRAKPYFESVFHVRDSKPIPKFKFGHSGDTLLNYGLWSRLFGFERSIEQPFQPVNEGIIAYWPPGSLMLSEKIHFRFLNANG